MNRATCLLALVMTVFGSARVRADGTEFAVVGYLPEYRMANVSAEQIGPVTDLVYFGLEPPENGRLSDAPVDPAVLRKLQKIKRVANCRLLISIGGWKRSEGFPALARSAVVRQRYIADLKQFCQTNGFDGVDYDWEHPKGVAQLRDYAQLLSDTKQAFRDEHFIVTVAQAGWQNLGEAAYAAVDRVHLMSYDHEFPQATFAKSKADVDRLVGWRCPAGKITLGLPFYGRNTKNVARTYSQLVGSNTIDPKLDRMHGFAFNGRETIIRKVRFAMSRELAGIMIWELGQDSPLKEASLLTTIDTNLRSTLQQQGRDK